MSFPRKASRRATVAAFWLALWWGCAEAVGQTLLLPAPGAVFTRWLAALGDGAFWQAIAASLLRVLLGFVLGASLGAIFAALGARHGFLGDLLAPLLSLAKATPVASFIVLALIWMPADWLPTFATTLVVTPLFWGNLSAALAAQDADLLEMARAFRVPRRRRLRHILLPALRPALRGSILTGMGMAWKSGIAAEVLCTPRHALGSFLYSGKVYLDMPGVFATTATLILLSIALERFALWALSRAKRGEQDVQP